MSTTFEEAMARSKQMVYLSRGVNLVLKYRSIEVSAEQLATIDKKTCISDLIIENIFRTYARWKCQLLL